MCRVRYLPKIFVGTCGFYLYSRSSAPGYGIVGLVGETTIVFPRGGKGESYTSNCVVTRPPLL